MLTVRTSLEDRLNSLRGRLIGRIFSIIGAFAVLRYLYLSH
jgi:hypothetical protein